MNPAAITKKRKLAVYVKRNSNVSQTRIDFTESFIGKWKSCFSEHIIEGTKSTIELCTMDIYRIHVGHGSDTTLLRHLSTCHMACATVFTLYKLPILLIHFHGIFSDT